MYSMSGFQQYHAGEKMADATEIDDRQMKISVVTAVYRAENTITQAIKSVASQTYPNVEHVVVDGASPDGTLDAIRAHQTENMVVSSEPDNGIYDALNKGIMQASGEVIGIVHSDDFLAHPQVLERVAKAFCDPSVDAVYGDLDYVSKDNTSRIIRHWRAGAYERRKLSLGWMPPHPTLFLRRRVFEAHGLYDTSYRIAADYDAVLRYFGSGGIKAVYLPEVLVKMRVGGESNKSLRKIWQKTQEDYRALRQNGVGGLGALTVKNLSKAPQFLKKSTAVH
ncbi:MAG: glycosyltransferase family 2 protein [Maritimibacter sp.]